MKVFILGTLLVFALWSPYALSQNAPASNNNSNLLSYITGGFKQFAIELLLETTLNAAPCKNLVISPYGVWEVFVMIMEGSAGETATQIRNTLHLPEDIQKLRSGYDLLDKALKSDSLVAELDSMNVIFTDFNRPLNWEFENTMSTYYDANIFPVNFFDPVASAKAINEWVSAGTRNRITELVQPDDLGNPQLFLANAGFFKGLWDKPFNVSNTFMDKFYSEDGNFLKDVKMMYQSGDFPYSYMEELNAHFLELPYGGDKYSMLLALPRGKTPLVDVLQKMKTMPLDSVYDLLVEAHTMYEGEEVDVYIPRISVESDFVLNNVLEKMGIVDAFSEMTADLSGMSSHQIYISKLIHKAEVEITEEGTVASSSTGVTLGNKSYPPSFHANKPFAYFIIEKNLRMIIFAGTVSNPDVE